MHPSTASTLASHSNYSPCNVLMNLQVCEGRGRGTKMRMEAFMSMYVCMCQYEALVCLCVTPDQACFSVRRLSASQGCATVSHVHNCPTFAEI